MREQGVLLFTTKNLPICLCGNVFAMKMINLLELIKHQSCHHIVTSQFICRANQLTGFYMMATLPFNELKAPLLPLTTSCRIANQLNLPTNQTLTKTWKGYSNAFPESRKGIFGTKQGYLCSSTRSRSVLKSYRKTPKVSHFVDIFQSLY